MNPEVKSLWLSALRSGEFQQTSGVLQSSDNRYCCLGVLCELHRRSHPENKWENPPEHLVGFQYLGNRSVLPIPVAEWAGLEDSNPIPKDAEQSLAEYNDDGLDFNAIADKIERGL